MKRALFSQIKNEWKENLWLVIELLIVALVIWGLAVFVIRTIRDVNYPKGFDETGVYYGDIQIFDDDGNQVYGFGYGDTPAEQIAEVVGAKQALLDRIRRMPMVEYAAYGNNPLPYNYTFIGNGLEDIVEGDTVTYTVNIRKLTPEGAKVLGLYSPDGKDADALAAVLERGETLLGSSPLTEQEGIDLGHFVGSGPLTGNFNYPRIGATFQGIRRTQYEINIPATMLIPIRENSAEILQCEKLLLKVKPGMERDFERALEDDPSILTYKNVHLDGVHSLLDDKLRLQWNSDVRQRTYFAGALLLLFIVFLGLLGTFWYRVYQRTSEIAVRKSFGATDSDIFRRFISEAMTLLGIALILATGIALWAIGKLSTSYLATVTYFHGWQWDMALAGIITFALMSIMLLAGVGIPARRAMKIEPALALKSE